MRGAVKFKEARPSRASVSLALTFWAIQLSSFKFASLINSLGAHGLVRETNHCSYISTRLTKLVLHLGSSVLVDAPDLNKKQFLAF